MVKTSEDLFIKQYLEFLHSRTKEKIISENVTRITTPLLDKNNDSIEVYIIKNNNSYIITDDGYILGDLETSGLSFDKNSLRYKYLQSILHNHGASLNDNHSISVTSSGNDLALRLHMLTQAMIKISDLFILNKKNVQSLFTEDVKTYFENNDIRYIENAIYAGKSKLETRYDFTIPKSKKSPERIVSTTQSLDSNFTKMAIFSWEDIKNYRPDKAILYVMFDDRTSKEVKGMRTALANYGAKVIDWTKRDDFIDELSA